MKDLKGKVAVVTGGASGIGRAMAERFAAEGMKVVLADIEEAALAAAESEMRAQGATVASRRTDVSRGDDVEALARFAVDTFGAVHVVCNNAGVAVGGVAWQQTVKDWEWVLGVNLWGVIYGIRAFVPFMLKQGDECHIVNTASVAGLISGAGDASYTASKFGVVGLSETLHHEVAAASGGKIKVSVLCPALTATNILDAGRNHPSGPQAGPPEGTPERAMWEMMKSYFASGMQPSETASLVFDAIVIERFYVLTHPEHNDRFRARLEAMLAGGPPPSLMPGT
jgi:NAD(P)-dependent dehydrogenase (short-subunit alcohol dehydrogenase family)